MSELERLIEELCPDGVEYVPLGDVVVRTRGTVITAAQMKQLDKENAPIKIFAGGKTVAYFDYGDLPEKDIQTIPSIIVKSRGVVEFEYYDKLFSHKNEMWSYHSENPEVNIKYVYYFLKTQEGKLREKATSMGTFPQIAIPDTETLIIPLPPLPIQREIVRILDNFTELTAELTARKKQYEYYRNMLLKLSDAPRTTLGEIGRVAMCKRIMKAETASEGDVPFYKIGTFGKKADAYIFAKTYERYKRDYSYPKKGDVLISAAGTIGRAVIYNGEPAYYQDSNIVWLEHDEDLALNRYLFYCYQLSPWHVSTGGTISRLYNDNISKAKIPLPPLAEQARIVAMLDKFDALTTDISSGLPAEIDARRKQYEYYRDKLLSFKEVGA